MIEVAIGEFCQTGSGGTPSRGKAARYYGGAIPWVKSGELRESVILETEETITEEALRESSAKLVPAGALLVAMYGATIGRVAELGIEASTNQAVCHIVPKKGLATRRYLFHALQAKASEWVSKGAGGAQPNISQGIIRETKIFLPPLPEQKRIAAILDKADEIRRKRAQAIKLTEELLKSAFLEMFGDPVTNPKGWERSSFGAEATLLQYGPRFYNQDYSPDGVPIARITDLNQVGQLDFEKMPRMSVEPTIFEKFKLLQGDIIFARTGSVGKVSLIREGDPGVIAGAYFIRLQFDQKRLDPLYVYMVLQSPGIRDIVNTKASCAVQPNFSGPAIRELPLPVPRLDQQTKFRSLEKRIRAGQVQSLAADGASQRLAESLTQRAFRGEL